MGRGASLWVGVGYYRFCGTGYVDALLGTSPCAVNFAHTISDCPPFLPKRGKDWYVYYLNAACVLFLHSRVSRIQLLTEPYVVICGTWEH